MAMRQLLLSDDYPTDCEIGYLLMEEPTSGDSNIHQGDSMSNQQIADVRPAGILHQQNGCFRRLLLSDEYPTDCEIHSILLMKEPTSGDSNIQQGASMSNQQIADRRPAGILHHQNGCFQSLLLSDVYPTDCEIRSLLLMKEPTSDDSNNHQGAAVSNQQTAGVPNTRNLNVGQLGLNQSRARAARPPNGLTSRRTIPLPPMQVQLARYQVRREQVVTTISTREFVPIPNQDSFLNTNPGVVYETHQTVTKTAQLFPTSRQILTEGQTPSHNFHSNDFLRKHEGFTVHSLPFPETNQHGNTIHPCGPGGNQVVPSHQLMIIEQKPPTQKRVHPRYPCLKCGEMFVTELCYAEHMASHYQATHNAKLMIRKASSYFKKRTHVAQSRCGKAKSSGRGLNITGKQDLNQRNKNPNSGCSKE